MSARMNRRAILAGAAAVAVPVPALAAADPTFATIAARKAAVAAFKNAYPRTDEVLDAFCDIDSEAIRVMLSTPPTTLAGLQALVRYVSECEAGGDDVLGVFMDPDEDAGAFGRTMGDIFHRTLLTALERL